MTRNETTHLYETMMRLMAPASLDPLSTIVDYLDSVPPTGCTRWRAWDDRAHDQIVVRGEYTGVFGDPKTIQIALDLECVFKRPHFEPDPLRALSAEMVVNPSLDLDRVKPQDQIELSDFGARCLSAAHRELTSAFWERMK